MTTEPSWGDMMYDEEMAALATQTELSPKVDDSAKPTLRVKQSVMAIREDLMRHARQQRAEAEMKARLQQEHRIRMSKNVLGTHPKTEKGRVLLIAITTPISSDTTDDKYLLFQHYCNKWSFFKTEIPSDIKELNHTNIGRLRQHVKEVLSYEFGLDDDDYGVSYIVKEPKKQYFVVEVNISTSINLLTHMHPSTKITDYAWIAWNDLLNSNFKNRTAFADKMTVYSSIMNKFSVNALERPDNWCQSLTKGKNPKTKLEPDEKLLNNETQLAIPLLQQAKKEESDDDKDDDKLELEPEPNV